MPRFGPRITSRDRTRIRLSQGIVRKRTGKGTFVDLDISPLYLAVADGLADAGAAVLDIATPDAPDDPTTPGSRIRESAQYGIIAFGQVLPVEGSPRDWKRPRRFRPNPTGVDMVVTFRSRLHHLHELGTVRMRARPYLGPARAIVAPQFPRYIGRRMPKGGAGA